MDKLTAIKIKYDDGTYSDEIPVSVLSENVEWDSTHTLVDILGSVDVDVTGTIQDQISRLFNEKVNYQTMVSYITSNLGTTVTAWLNENVNPVGSAVIVDESLTIEGAAADSKKVGQKFNEIKYQTIFNAMDVYPISYPSNLVYKGISYNSTNDIIHMEGTTPEADGVYRWDLINGDIDINTIAGKTLYAYINFTGQNINSRIDIFVM